MNRYIQINFETYVFWVWDAFFHGKSTQLNSWCQATCRWWQSFVPMISRRHNLKMLTVIGGGASWNGRWDSELVSRFWKKKHFHQVQSSLQTEYDNKSSWRAHKPLLGELSLIKLEESRWLSGVASAFANHWRKNFGLVIGLIVDTWTPCPVVHGHQKTTRTGASSSTLTGNKGRPTLVCSPRTVGVELDLCDHGLNHRSWVEPFHLKSDYPLLYPASLRSLFYLPKFKVPYSTCSPNLTYTEKTLLICYHHPTPKILKSRHIIGHHHGHCAEQSL